MTAIIETYPVNTAAAIEMKIAAAVNAFHAALTEADKESLDVLLSNDLSYGHSNGVVEGKSAFIENVINGNSVFITIDILEQSIKAVGGTAIVRHVFKAETGDQNVSATIVLRVLLVLQMQDDQWKLLARQAVRA